MRRMYSFLMYCALPMLVVRLFWKGRSLLAYRQRIAERFAFKKGEMVAVDVWVHAVSLGEVVAATELIENLLQRSYRVLVTTITPTGSQQVMTTFGNRVQHQYLPFDVLFCIKRFLKQYKPSVCVILETEIWPNLLAGLYSHNIPAICVNGRISDRAYKKYQRLTWFFRPILQKYFKHILAQSAVDAERYCELGAHRDQVIVAGNLKFDINKLVPDQKLIANWRNLWGRHRRVLIAASTHDGEESAILAAFLKLPKKQRDSIILLIAPRHPERFEAVFELASKQCKAVLRTEFDQITSSTEVVILNCIGELRNFFMLSDFAFIGGSLVPIGGHNVLEPIAAGVPTLCGYFMQNAKSVCDELVSKKGLCQVADADELIKTVLMFIEHPKKCEAQVAAASDILDSNKGATSLCLEKIESFF